VKCGVFDARRFSLRDVMHYVYIRTYIYFMQFIE